VALSSKRGGGNLNSDSSISLVESLASSIIRIFSWRIVPCVRMKYFGTQTDTINVRSNFNSTQPALSPKQGILHKPAMKRFSGDLPVASQPNYYLPVYESS
jgi:hypothetical protein